MSAIMHFDDRSSDKVDMGAVNIDDAVKFFKSLSWDELVSAGGDKSDSCENVRHDVFRQPVMSFYKRNQDMHFIYAGNEEWTCVGELPNPNIILRILAPSKNYYLEKAGSKQVLRMMEYFFEDNFDELSDDMNVGICPSFVDSSGNDEGYSEGSVQGDVGAAEPEVSIRFADHRNNEVLLEGIDAEGTVSLYRAVKAFSDAPWGEYIKKVDKTFMNGDCAPSMSFWCDGQELAFETVEEGFWECTFNYCSKGWFSDSVRTCHLDGVEVGVVRELLGLFYAGDYEEIKYMCSVK